MLSLMTCMEFATGWTIGSTLMRWTLQRRQWHQAQQAQAELSDAVIHLPPDEFEAWIDKQATALAHDPAWLPAELAQIQPVARPTFMALWTWSAVLWVSLIWVGIVGVMYATGLVAQEIVVWWQQPSVVVQAPRGVLAPTDGQLPMEAFFQQLYVTGTWTYLPMLALMILITSVLNMHFGWVNSGGMTRLLMCIAILAGGLGLVVGWVGSLTH